MRTRSWRVLVAAAAGFALVGAGTSAAQAADSKKAFSKGYTQVVVAPEVFQLISGAGITPEAVKPATARPTPSTLAVKFPISSVKLSKLQVKHKGGVRLSAGSARISLRNFTVDVNKLRISGTVNSRATGRAEHVPLFTLSRSDRTQFGALKLSLTKGAADALNTTFGVNAFAEGATFGYATVKPRA